MKTRWEKLGQLYTPEGRTRHPKLLTHAANPLPVRLHEDVYRVFYSGRDASNRSSVGAVDIDILRRQVIREHDAPIFEFGPAGSFYADGISIGCCYSVGGVRYMLFMGWQSPPDSHFRGDIGRMVMDASLRLTLDGDQPFLGANAIDPISLSYPWVCEAPEGGYVMWYGSTETWDAGNGEMLHAISSATSADGHQWARHGQAVPHVLGAAQAFSRPTVVRGKDGSYQMWFSCRGAGEKYRIGYAHSDDGKQWRLSLEDAGITVSDSGWDSEMIAYPYVMDHEGQRYMFYNGNSYGKTGFGLAVWRDT
ncbi:FIG01214411: hypothetical protein [plant metagenome]|uniref:Glycosyl hydrolase family 32 N-terminal domain-containing protein n=1 Tax=plant metagenome TaxID=1297885 RepID=A0A484U3L6_9ZZZZ